MEQMNLKDIFGCYFYNKPIDFEFARGERKKIKCIASYINSTLKEKGLKDCSKYFDQGEDSSKTGTITLYEKSHNSNDLIKQTTRTHFL